MTIEEIEELESINAYDEAKASNDEVIPFDQAMMEIKSHQISDRTVWKGNV